MTVMLLERETIGNLFNQIVQVEKRHVVEKPIEKRGCIEETSEEKKGIRIYSSCHDVVNLNSSLPFNKR